MPTEAAPFFTDIAYGPPGGAAVWATTSDDVRIRVGYWPLEAARGTVLMFPGRTEFVEKYGHTAREFAKRHLASVAIDWRGQGLADRLLENPLVGHVDRFSDYQKDIAALLKAISGLALPRPYYLLAHSMGGAIGLRALVEGLNVDAVVFSGPMWGLQIAPHLRPAAWVLSHTMPQIGQGHKLPPGSKLEHHVLVDGFEDNLLTRDKTQFSIMQEQLSAHPQLALGGPSYVWLREALQEIRHLSRLPSPSLPCLAFIGSNERIVAVKPIEERMRAWPNGRLEIVPDGEHEVLMESDEVIQPLFDRMAAHFLSTLTETPPVKDRSVG